MRCRQDVLRVQSKKPPLIQATRKALERVPRLEPTQDGSKNWRVEKWRKTMKKGPVWRQMAFSGKSSTSRTVER